MPRTKQTPKRVVGQPRLPRARFAAPMDDATPSTCSASGSTATADTRGKRLRGRATKAARKTGRRRTPVNMKRVPPALRIAKENANARMTGANATPKATTSLQTNKRVSNGGLEREHFGKSGFTRNLWPCCSDVCLSCVSSGKWHKISR